MKIIYLLLIAVLAGCSSASKLRRAEKLIKKAEELGARWRVDTLFVRTAVPVPEIHWDSVIVAKPGDTVVISKDRLQVKYVRLRGDTVFVEAKCEADTIYQKVPVTIVKQIEADCFWKWWHMVLALIAGVCLWMGIIQVKKAGSGK